MTASRREACRPLLLLLVRHRQGGALQRPFVDHSDADPRKHAIPRPTYMNPFSACMFESRRSALRLVHSPASRTLWTAARAFVVVGGGVVVVVVVVGAAVVVVVVGAVVVVVVGSGVVVVVGSGAVAAGGWVVTSRLLASFRPTRR